MGVSTSVALRQCLQQHLGLLEVGGVKPLGEPAVDRRQQRAGLSTLPLMLPQPTQAHCRAQLPGFSLLATSNGQSLLEIDLRLGCIRDNLAKEEFTLEPIRLRKHVTPPAGLERCHGFSQYALLFLDLASMPRSLGE